MSCLSKLTRLRPKRNRFDDRRFSKPLGNCSFGMYFQILAANITYHFMNIFLHILRPTNNPYQHICGFVDVCGNTTKIKNTQRFFENICLSWISHKTVMYKKLLNKQVYTLINIT
jgi:hypothetical protein